MKLPISVQFRIFSFVMKQTHVYQDPLFAPIDLEVAM